MRRMIVCCLSLALGFTLTFLQPGSTALGGDLLSAGGCQFFSDADFAPIEPGKLKLPNFDFASSMGSAPTRTPKSTLTSTSAKKSKVTPILMTYISRSTRTWNFDYQPVSKPVAKRPRVVLLWHTQQVNFRLKPSVTVPIRSLKKHTAPVLFWGPGSVADMTIVFNLVSREFGELVKTGISPANELPLRIVRMAQDCFGLR